MAVTVTELSPNTGVEVSGLSGWQLVDRAVADKCLEALDERGVVIYREADIDDDQLVAFSRLLGDVVALPMGGHDTHREIQRITRDATKSKLAAYREATFFWHIDGTPDAVEHPLVWTRQSGRKSLLVGATAGEVVGRSPEEGRALLGRLLEWSTQPKFVIRHQWRRGDLVIWDNTGMLHRARPYGEGSARLMHRTSLAGQESVA